jgi:hypothetical protein
MDLDDQGIKHEVETMSGVVRGAVLKILLGMSWPVFEFPMQYKTKSFFY